jgi:Flp pilus assembly protein TadB
VSDKELRHLLRLLRVEYPDAHFFTLALKIQAQTGKEITGLKVKQILQELSS